MKSENKFIKFLSVLKKELLPNKTATRLWQSIFLLCLFVVSFGVVRADMPGVVFDHPECGQVCSNAGFSNPHDFYFSDIHIDSISSNAHYKEGRQIRVKGYIKMNSNKLYTMSGVTRLRGVFLAISLHYDVNKPTKIDCYFGEKRRKPNCRPRWSWWQECYETISRDCHGSYLNIGASSLWRGKVFYLLGQPHSHSGSRVPLSNDKFSFDYTFTIPNSAYIGINNDSKQPDVLLIYPSFEFDNMPGVGSFNIGSFGKYIYIDSTKIDGKCGFMQNSCVAGTFKDRADTATQWVWDCVGQDGGVTANCTKNKPGPYCGPVTNTVQGIHALNSGSNGLCQPSGATVSDFVDNSDLEGGYSWKCNLNGQSVSCQVNSRAVCNSAPTSAPYNSLKNACRFGNFNSLAFVNGKYTWRCGTAGDTNRHRGSFIDGNINAGPLVPRDYYDLSGGDSSCKCAPAFEYSCISSGNGNACASHCGERVTITKQAFKKDKNCFPNDAPLIAISKTEYQSATGKTCDDEVKQCPPCRPHTFRETY